MTAAVDNVLTWETIPPGIVVDTPRGRRQKYMHDFFNYAGLHRPVWLYATPRTYLQDLHVTTGVDDPLAEEVAATVRYRAEIGGDDGAVTVRARLLDADGTERGTAEGADAAIELPDAHLWRPGEGYQYDLVIELVDSDGGGWWTPTGSCSASGPSRSGAPSSSSTATPFYFTGLRHARGPRGARQGPGERRDGPRLRAAGLDRRQLLPHLPLPLQRGVLDYADAHGIVVIDETAAVGMNATLAAVLGTRIDRVYGPDAISERTAQTHAQAIRELMARDKNRPSVVIWSIANEPESHTDDAVRLLRAALRAGPQPRPDPARRLRQRHARPAGEVQSLTSSATSS